MSSLTTAEKRYFENIFGMSTGYVLDFSDATYDDFFSKYGIDIHGDKKYLVNGTSKAKKMRTFWEQDEDATVARILNELLDLYEADCNVNGLEINVKVLQKCRETVDRLQGKSNKSRPTTDKEFLSKKVDIPAMQKLPIPPPVVEVIEERLREAGEVLEAGAHLSAIILYGSVLEAVLLGAALSKPKQFNQSRSSPKTKEGKVKQFHEWTLSQFIDVACDIGILEPDVKVFSHGLRNFRNYIHPYATISSNFTPDGHTASICFQVLKVALVSVAGER